MTTLRRTLGVTACLALGALSSSARAEPFQIVSHEDLSIVPGFDERYVLPGGNWTIRYTDFDGTSKEHATCSGISGLMQEAHRERRPLTGRDRDELARAILEHQARRDRAEGAARGMGDPVGRLYVVTGSDQEGGWDRVVAEGIDAALAGGAVVNISVDGGRPQGGPLGPGGPGGAVGPGGPEDGEGWPEPTIRGPDMPAGVRGVGHSYTIYGAARGVATAHDGRDYAATIYQAYDPNHQVAPMRVDGTSAFVYFREGPASGRFALAAAHDRRYQGRGGDFGRMDWSLDPDGYLAPRQMRLHPTHEAEVREAVREVGLRPGPLPKPEAYWTQPEFDALMEAPPQENVQIITPGRGLFGL